MKANYHTHTVRCNHASGTEREFIETALKCGMEELGFSDHTPYFAMPLEVYSGFRMKPWQAQDYFDTLKALKEEYKGKIDIHIGVEAEYYPAMFDDLVHKLIDFGAEYMIMGQHFTKNEQGTPYATTPTDNEENLIEYVDQVCEGLDTGVYTYIAHPDVFNYVGDDRIYRKHYERLCVHAKELNIPLEINLLGIAGRRNYPSYKFFEIAASVGNKIILGCDAHSPGALIPGEAYEKGMKMVEDLKLDLIEKVSLVPIESSYKPHRSL